MTVEDCVRITQALDPALSEEERIDRLLEAMTEDQKLEMVMPSLRGLGLLLEGDLGDDIGVEVRDRVFDGFAGLGFDRATRTGALTQMLGGDVERSLRLSLTSDRYAREFFGFPPKESATPEQNRQLQAILYELGRHRAEFAEFKSSVGSGSETRKKVATFSEAATALIQHIATNKRADHPDLGTIRRVADTFLALVDDKPVDQYTKREIQGFVTDMSFVMPNFLKKRSDATLKDLRKHVSEQRAADAEGLAHSTLEGTYLDRVRSIIRFGCEDADVADLLTGKSIDIPDRAMAKRERRPLTADQMNTVFRLGAASGVLSDALLPLLGFMTGRRVGLLTYIRCEWLDKQHGVWLVNPAATMTVDGRKVHVPYKTAPSLKPFVLHQFFEEIGLIDWMTTRRTGWLFDHLATCADPADAAQKRMGRLFRKAGLDVSALETFHSLRSSRIATDFDLKMNERLKRLQVGHDLIDVHESYAPGFSRDEAAELRKLPVPTELDLSGFYGLDFKSLAAVRPKGGRTKAETKTA